MFDLTSGIGDMIVKQQQVKVYPNPAKGRVTVEFSEEPLALIKINVIGADGKKISTEEMNGRKKEFSIQHLPKGTYTLNISAEKGQEYGSHKLVVD